LPNVAMSEKVYPEIRQDVRETF